MSSDQEQYPSAMTHEQAKARGKRNKFLALGIVVFMGLVFLVTVVRMREGVVRNQDWQAETARGQQSDVAQSGEGTPPLRNDEAPN